MVMSSLHIDFIQVMRIYWVIYKIFRKKELLRSLSSGLSGRQRTTKPMNKKPPQRAHRQRSSQASASCANTPSQLPSIMEANR